MGFNSKLESLKEITKTDANHALLELANKGADVDMLRQMVQFMANRLMEIDVEGRCGATYDEKNPERTNSRNGYRDASGTPAPAAWP